MVAADEMRLHCRWAAQFVEKTQIIRITLKIYNGSIGSLYILKEKSEFMPIIIPKGILCRIIPTVHVCFICATFAAAGCFLAENLAGGKQNKALKHGERP